MLHTQCLNPSKTVFLARTGLSVWRVQGLSHVRKDITVQNIPTAPASIRAQQVTMVQIPVQVMSKSVVPVESDTTA